MLFGGVALAIVPRGTANLLAREQQGAGIEPFQVEQGDQLESRLAGGLGERLGKTAPRQAAAATLQVGEERSWRVAAHQRGSEQDPGRKPVHPGRRSVQSGSPGSDHGDCGAAGGQLGGAGQAC